MRTLLRKLRVEINYFRAKRAYSKYAQQNADKEKNIESLRGVDFKTLKITPQTHPHTVKWPTSSGAVEVGANPPKPKTFLQKIRDAKACWGKGTPTEIRFEMAKKVQPELFRVMTVTPLNVLYPTIGSTLERFVPEIPPEGLELFPLSGHPVSNVAPPVSSADAMTKQRVDALTKKEIIEALKQGLAEATPRHL